MEIEDKDIKRKKLLFFSPSNWVRWWSNFPLFSADLGRWKVGNLSPLIISAAWPK